LAAQWKDGQIELTYSARAADTTGYQNAARHYALESTPSLTPEGAWEFVPGFQDCTVTSGTKTFTCVASPTSETGRFYRLRTWLKQKP
jgi:hypothetical protein